MIEVVFNCDTCEKSVRRKYKTMSALLKAGQPKTFRLYKGAMSCVKCRRKIMGPKKFAQNKKVSDTRAEKKRIRDEMLREAQIKRRQWEEERMIRYEGRMKRYFEKRFGPIEDLK
jgi:hypothetical protein